MEQPQYNVMYQVEDTHFWYVGMRAITTSLLSHITLPPKAKILDAGCGTGANLIFLEDYGEAKGIDISPLALKLCRRRGLKALSLGSLNQIPLASNSFDFITCFDVLGHTKVKPQIAMAELNRVLKPGGVVLLRLAAYPWLTSLHDKIVQNERRYTKQSILQLTNSLNFSLVRATFANTFLFPAIALYRLLCPSSPPSHASDTRELPSWLNYLLLIPLIIESKLLAYLDLPFGLSLFVILRKVKA